MLSDKESACNSGDTKDMSLIPGSGRSPEEGKGNPLQYSCLGNRVDRSLAGCSLRGHKESDTTEPLSKAKRTRSVQACSLFSLSSSQERGRKKFIPPFSLFTAII